MNADVQEVIDFLRQHSQYSKAKLVEALVAVRAPLAVREHPLVAEYLVTLEAPSQATSDDEIAHVEKVSEAIVQSAIGEALPKLPKGYGIRVDPLAIGPRCAFCARPVLEQVASAARSNTNAMEAMQRVEAHRVEMEAACAAMRDALEPFFQLRYSTSPGSAGSGDRRDAAASIERARIALATDAGRLAAEVLRAADEWERQDTKLRDAAGSGGNDRSEHEHHRRLWDRLVVAVRARRGEG